MKKKFLSFILSLFIFCLISGYARAATGIGAVDTLTKDVTLMAQKINESSSEMMKLAAMLMCNALHGKDAYRSVSADVIGVAKVSLQFYFPVLSTLISGFVLYAIGFFIMLVASYYLFDVAFNISISLTVLPMGFALWPFGWTRDKLKPMIESIVYYTGVFIFLPMGIYIARLLVQMVAFDTPDFNFEEAFEKDNSELIAEHLGLFSLGFLKAVVCYVIAIRLIPLMAEDFCTHFFGGSLVGTPMADNVKKGVNKAKQYTLGKLGDFASDTAKKQTGDALQSAGDKDGNSVDRTIHSYGEQMSNNTKK